MEITALYAELIIIGLEASTWMFLLVVFFTDISVISSVSPFLDKISTSIILFGFLYVIGIAFDRFSDMVCEHIENKMRMDSELVSKSAMIVWKKAEQEDFAKYIRPRMRILRASAINFPVITISVLLDISKYGQFQGSLLVYVFILGAFLTVLAWMGYFDSAKRYYNKARVLELELEKKSKKITKE